MDRHMWLVGAALLTSWFAAGALGAWMGVNWP